MPKSLTQLIILVFLVTGHYHLLFGQSYINTFQWDIETTELIRHELITRSENTTTMRIPIQEEPVEFTIRANAFIKGNVSTPRAESVYQSFSGRDSMGYPIFGFFQGENLYLSYFKNGIITSIAPLEQSPGRYKLTRSGGRSDSGKISCSLLKVPGIRKGGQSSPCANTNYSSRTFDLFIACTGEWGNYFQGIKSNIRTAIARQVNAVNAFYTAEMNISFNLITDDQFLYTNSADDPFNPSGTNLAEQARNFFNNHVDNSIYDIGHVFHKRTTSGGGASGSGIAYLRAVCRDAYKGGGWTGTSLPENESFTFNIFGHEVGHQLGADHSFYGTAGNCSGTNRSSGNGFEPGSGSTLMSYEGQCGNHNITPTTSTHYFHNHSISQILEHLNSVSPCGGRSGSGSGVSVQIPGDFSVPLRTAFDLTATGDAYTYIWEQYDTDNQGSGSRSHPINGGNYATTPMYRSYDPSDNGYHRSFPAKDVQQSGNQRNGEVYATVPRDITMRLTSRAGGYVRCDEMTVTIRDAPPLQVTAPQPGQSIVLNTNENGRSGLMTVEWQTGDTESNGFPTVDILYSTDVGTSFQVLAEEVENDGIHEVRPPEINSDQARLKIQLTDGSGRMAIYHEQRQNFTVNFSVLPLEIAKFEGREVSDHHYLYWKLHHSAEHIRAMNLEYSYNGVRYDPIPILDSNGFKTAKNWSGSYVSHYRQGSWTYYRLAITDGSGAVSYSSVVRLHNNPNQNLFMKIYPNPVQSGQLRLEFQEYLQPDARIYVRSIQGFEVFRYHPAMRTRKIDLKPTWPDGLYIVETINGKSVYQKKLIVYRKE